MPRGPVCAVWCASDARTRLGFRGCEGGGRGEWRRWPVGANLLGCFYVVKGVFVSWL